MFVQIRHKNVFLTFFFNFLSKALEDYPLVTLLFVRNRSFDYLTSSYGHMSLSLSDSLALGERFL